MPDGGPSNPGVYRPRPPEGTALQRLVGATLPAFYRESERTLPHGLPRFVRRELEAFVGCGDFAKGFVQLKCERCPCERLVAFSCKTRGFCPSCGGKRMTALGAHLVDVVIPHVPVRQFVLTVPFELRAKMAYDAEFAGEVKRALHAALQSGYARRARERGVRDGRTGGVTAIQRFGSGLNLHVHFHALVLDGVFTGEDPLPPHFHDGRPWGAEEVARLLVDLVHRLLHRGVVDLEADVRSEMEELAEHDPLGFASCMHRIALGPRRGQRVERLGATKTLRRGELTVDPVRPKAQFCGFDLEASVRVPASDRKALERLCRYLLRPPIADKRLRFRDDGKVEVALKSPWPDGTTHLVFTPLELVEKAAALIPRPHANLLVYHGVLAANANGRAAIIDYARPFDAARAAAPSTEPTTEADGDGENAKPKPRSRSARDWATMMRRGLDIDVLTCPNCGARLRLRALLDDPRVARPFAEKMGLVRTRAGPADLPAVRHDDTAYEPDLDFVDPNYDLVDADCDA